MSKSRKNYGHYSHPLLLAYHTQKSGATRRGIAWLFTFEDWLELWAASGRLSERGHGNGYYVMARFGDKGPYSPDNVKIILFEDNVREQVHDAEECAKRWATRRRKAA